MSGATMPVPQGTRFMVQWEEHPMHLATRLGYLLEHQSLVDVTLMCNTHTLKVHRSVLAACSPYFESVLQRQLGNHPLIVLKDMKFCVLKSLIEFMYCGETSVTEENLNPLMEAAKFFEVKGLCTMSKEVLGGGRPSPNKPVTAPVNGTMNSSADLIPATTYRGRGRRPGVGRGRRNLSTMLSPPTSGGAPQSETAQIMLSLSGNPNGPTLQTTSRNVRISPTGRMGRPIQPASTVIPMRNGALTTTDLKALREQLNLEPRRRGRRRQNYGFGRGRIKDLVDGKFGTQNIKKEPEEVQQKDGVIFKPLDSKVSLFNNNGNNDAKSPLLASLLSKAEALAKAKVKTEHDNEQGPGEEQETVVYQFDGESSGASKYLDALKEAGLPTDVPVLIDNGDGNYVTLTEDVLMNVLGNNEEFQFQVTEATLEQGDVSEGVVLQDGTIMMTGKNKSDISGPLLTVGRKSVSVKGVREVKGKRGPRQRQNNPKDTQAKTADKSASPQKNVKKEPAKKKSELISDEVLESLKNGAASEAEADPDAVVLFEVTDNHKVCKYVVSSKEISALKALNEQIGKQKNQNSPSEKKDPVPTVVDGNTNIAEIKLNFPKNSRKSIVSEVLARAHSLENQVKTSALTNSSEKNYQIKNEGNSPQILDINMGGDVLNDNSELIGLSPSRDNLENPNTLGLVEDSQILDENNGMMVLHRGSQLMHISDGQHEGIALSENENLIVVNNNNQILHHERDDVTEARSEDSQIMQINECSQDDGDTETTQEGIEEINDEDMNAIESSGRDMPLLESESQLVELEFIDGSGEKIQRYRVEGNVLSQKISELADLSDQGKNNVIGLLDMVCEEAAEEVHESNQMLTTLKEEVDNKELINQAVPCTSAITLSVTTVENSVSQSDYSVGMTNKNQLASRSDHLVLVETVNNEDTRHFDSVQEPLDDSECQVLSAGVGTNSDQLVLEEAMKSIIPRHLGTDVITLGERDCQLSEEQSRSEHLMLEDTTDLDTRQLDVGSMSLDEEDCQVSAEPTRSENLVLEEKVEGINISHLETGEMTIGGRGCQDLSDERASITEHVMLEDDVDKIHTRDLESGVMSLDEENCQEISPHTRPEHLELEDAVKNIDTRHMESGDMSLDERDCQELSVEQALQAMMGDSGRNREEQENQEFTEEIKPLDNISCQDENKLQQLTESSNDLNNHNDFELVYQTSENSSIEGITNITSEMETQIVLVEEHAQKDAAVLDEDGIMKEDAERTIISPTKSIPFAVGLLPLKDALVQIQSTPDYQPRKTRSGSISKPEGVGSKRRSSMENSDVGSVKRRKSFEEQHSSNSVADNGTVVNTT